MNIGPFVRTLVAEPVSEPVPTVLDVTDGRPEPVEPVEILDEPAVRDTVGAR